MRWLHFDVKENYDFPGRSAQIIIRNEANTQRVTDYTARRHHHL